MTQPLNVASFGCFKKAVTTAVLASIAMRPIKYFEGARLWLTETRKSLSDDRPPLADIPLAITEEKLKSSLCPSVVMKLQRASHSIAGMRIVGVFSCGFLKARERVTRSVVSGALKQSRAGGSSPRKR